MSGSLNTPPIAYDNDPLNGSFYYFRRANGWAEIFRSALVGDDFDPDGDALTIIAVGDASVGTVTLVNVGSEQKVVFVPEKGILGIEGMTFNYTISDGRGGTDTASVTILPREIDAPPQQYSLAEDTGLVLQSLPTLRYVGSFSQPEHGEIVTRFVSGPSQRYEIVYIPDPDFNGTDSFTITDEGESNVFYTEVTVTVSPVDEPTPPASYVRGTAGADVLDQSAATSRVQIAGLDGNDTIRGGSGSDALNGGAGSDVISGGAGNDTIIGGLGADRLAGGAGLDTFLIALGDLAQTNATDLIYDFQGAGVAGGDVIRFTGFAVGSTLTLVGTSGNAMVYEVQDAGGVSEGRLLVSAGGTLGQALTASDYAFA